MVITNSKTRVDGRGKGRWRGWGTGCRLISTRGSKSDVNMNEDYVLRVNESSEASLRNELQRPDPYGTSGTNKRLTREARRSGNSHSANKSARNKTHSRLWKSKWKKAWKNHPENPTENVKRMKRDVQKLKKEPATLDGRKCNKR